MDMLRFATAGSVDDGKSTLIGRLLYDSKSIFEDQLDAVERASQAKGDDYVNLALLTDGLRAEREQGITIDVAYRYFATPNRKFVVADTPGHVQYTRNMVTGASTADLAIVLVVIDDPQLPLRLPRGDELLDDLRHRVGVRLDRACARRAAERSHPALHHLRLLARHRHQERLFLDDERGAADDDLALLGEVERDDRNLLDVDVLPDVDLGPVREREHADALAGAQLAVQQAPELGPLPLRIPLAVAVADREDTLLRARALLVAASAADGRVEVAGLQRVEQRLGLEQPAAALRADLERLRAFADGFFVGVDDQPRADGVGHLVAERDHFLELVGRVDVEERKRNRARVERLLREAQHAGRVLADRVEHHRPLELGDHFPKDLDALGLERTQVIQARRYFDVHVHWQGNSRHPFFQMAKTKKARGFASPGFRSLCVVRSLAVQLLLHRDR